MIIWGGHNISGVDLATGGRYNPNGNSWMTTATLGAPGARRNHTAVWTGREMIVWGGCCTNSLGVYFPYTIVVDALLADGFE